MFTSILCSWRVPAFWSCSSPLMRWLCDLRALVLNYHLLFILGECNLWLFSMKFTFQKECLDHSSLLVAWNETCPSRQVLPCISAGSIYQWKTPCKKCSKILVKLKGKVSFPPHNSCKSFQWKLGVWEGGSTHKVMLWKWQILWLDSCGRNYFRCIKYSVNMNSDFTVWWNSEFLCDSLPCPAWKSS